ncbi:hypothetical protein AVEN_273209-1 [Araneus ventricosus]|uniref:Uncharacterized protein n=1 Tax=Araneus ventricosus TaxID=182803 RepID=A0A4Y2GR65_ARAVE|nr:hypothetical protein AVEN_273209-1 [Araneus ventricosus]
MDSSAALHTNLSLVPLYQQIAATGFRSKKIPKQYYRKLLVKTATASLDHGDSKIMKIDVLQVMNNDGLAKCFTENDKKNCLVLGGFLTPVDFNPIEKAKSDNFVPAEKLVKFK